MPEEIEKPYDNCLCQNCQVNEAAEPHTCPYREEIECDSTECNCCDQCCHECEMDI